MDGRGGLWARRSSVWVKGVGGGPLKGVGGRIADQGRRKTQKRSKQNAPLVGGDSALNTGGVKAEGERSPCSDLECVRVSRRAPCHTSKRSLPQPSAVACPHQTTPGRGLLREVPSERRQRLVRTFHCPMCGDENRPPCLIDRVETLAARGVFRPHPARSPVGPCCSSFLQMMTRRP